MYVLKISNLGTARTVEVLEIGNCVQVQFCVAWLLGYFLFTFVKFAYRCRRLKRKCFVYSCRNLLLYVTLQYFYVRL